MQQVPFCSIWYRQAMCPSVHKTNKGFTHYTLILLFPFQVSFHFHILKHRRCDRFSQVFQKLLHFPFPYTSLQRSCHCQQSRALNSIYTQSGINCLTPFLIATFIHEMLPRTEWSHLHLMTKKLVLSWQFFHMLCQFAIKKVALPSSSSILES